MDGVVLLIIGYLCCETVNLASHIRKIFSVMKWSKLTIREHNMNN